MAQLRHDYDKFLERQTAVVIFGPSGGGGRSRGWREAGAGASLRRLGTGGSISRRSAS